VTFDLYAWKSPCDLDVDRAEALLRGWHESGGDPRESPTSPVPMSAGSIGSS
jgi:hypothetical protein